MQYNLKPKPESSKIEAKARSMYMMGVGPAKISQILGINKEMLDEWILGANKKGDSPNCWSMVKQSMTDVVIDTIIHTQLETTMNIVGHASKILLKGLKKLSKKIQSGEDEDISIRDLKTISEIIANMDKIARLERMEPTEITGNISGGMSLEEARDVIKNDPFFKTINTTCKEVKHGNSEGDTRESTRRDARDNEGGGYADVAKSNRGSDRDGIR
jgi:hypothetical protein